MRHVIILGILVGLSAASAAQSDPQLVRIPSGGTVMFGAMFTAEGQAAKPTVVLLHGHAGNSVVQRGAQGNVLDLAQPLQRAGFNVLTFNYRGAWGSGGSYSLLNRMEDVKTAIAFARNAGARMGIDPARLSLVGHSAGGFNALAASIDDSSIACTVAIAPANYGTEALDRIQHAPVPPNLADPVAGLAGYTERDLRNEVVGNQARLNLTARLSALRGRPLLIVQGKQDTSVPAGDVAPYITGATAAGASPFDHVQIDADHNFTMTSRQELASVVVGWLTKNCK